MLFFLRRIRRSYSYRKGLSTAIMNRMERVDTYEQRQAAMQRLLRGVTFGLILLMPFSVFFAFGPPADRNILSLYAHRGFYLSDLPLAMLLVLSLIADVPWRRGPLLVTGALAIICVLAFVSIPQSVSPPFTFYIAVRWLLAFYVYVWFVQPVAPASQVAAVFAAGMGIHALVGVAQVIIQGPVGLPGELALVPQADDASMLAISGVRWLRAYGLAFHPNVLGGFLAVALLLLIPWLERLPAVGLWWLLWSGLLLTFSRAAWLAVALALPVALIAYFVKRRQAGTSLAIAAGGALIVFAAAIFLMPEQFTTRLSPLLSLFPRSGAPVPVAEPEAFSISERVELTDVGWEIIGQRPWRGVGAGNFPLAMPRLRPLMRAQSVHNIPLLLASEVGLLGGALWLMMGFVVIARLILHWRKASPWLLSAICAWGAVAFIAFFDSYLWSLNSGLLLTAMVLGLASRGVRDSG